jgi:hypothetical protein
MAIFLSDFSVEVTATTWGTTVDAIFDKDYVEFDDISTESPYLLMQSSDVPGSATSGDAFTVAGTNYKLVDIQHAEPGMSRIVLALA